MFAEIGTIMLTYSISNEYTPKKYANHYNYNITINFGHTRYEVTITLIFIYIINYPLAELNQRMLNPSYRFPIY